MLSTSRAEPQPADKSWVKSVVTSNVRASAGASTPSDGSSTTSSLSAAAGVYGVAAKLTVIPTNGAASTATTSGSEDPPIAQVAAVVTETSAISSETQTERSGSSE